MGISDIQRSAVLRAVEEFNRLGRERFLELYNYGKAKQYFLKLDGKFYDSKAILGVAHKYQFPVKGPLKSDDFSGGKLTVQQKLEELGFTVVIRKLKPL